MLIFSKVRSAHHAWQMLSNVRNVKKVNYRDVNEYLHSQGEFVIPLLKTKVSDVNVQKRLQYAKDYLRFDFTRTLFTDESRFELNANTLKVWRFVGQPRPLRHKWPQNASVMIWGGVSCQGKTSLHFIKGSLDGEGYRELISEHKAEIKRMFGRKKWDFVQDGAPCHRAKASIDYLKKNLTKSLLHTLLRAQILIQ